MEADRYLELARREDGLAREAREQSEAARGFALRQVDEGLREHFLRRAGRAKMDSLSHAARARRFEAIASSRRASSGQSARDPQRAMAQANVELVKQALAACLRNDFEVAPEHLPKRTARGSDYWVPHQT